MGIEKYFDWECIELLQDEQVSQLEKVEYKYKDQKKKPNFNDYFWHFVSEVAELLIAVLKSRDIDNIREEIADVTNMCYYMYQESYKMFKTESGE